MNAYLTQDEQAEQLEFVRPIRVGADMLAERDQWKAGRLLLTIADDFETFGDIESTSDAIQRALYALEDGEALASMGFDSDQDQEAVESAYSMLLELKAVHKIQA